jgi:hypothetical protein
VRLRRFSWRDPTCLGERRTLRGVGSAVDFGSSKWIAARCRRSRRLSGTLGEGYRLVVAWLSVRRPATGAESMSEPRRAPLRAAMPFSVVLAGFAATLLACDRSSLSASPATTCAEVGAQCQLAEGPLGVCERSPCAAGGTPPCFRCIPQH